MVLLKNSYRNCRLPSSGDNVANGNLSKGSRIFSSKYDVCVVSLVPVSSLDILDTLDSHGVSNAIHLDQHKDLNIHTIFSVLENRH